MNSEIWGALAVFLVSILVVLGAIVKMVPDWVARLGNGFINLWEAKIEAQITALKKDLKANTAITTEARDLSNGRLHEALDRAAKAEQKVREYEDLINALRRNPDLAPIIAQYRDRRTQRSAE